MKKISKVIFLIIFQFSIFNFQSFSQTAPGIEWTKCYGGDSTDAAYSVQQTTDGNYIVAGVTASTNGNVNNNHGGFDFWIIKIDFLGNIIWKKCYGGSGDDLAYSIQQTNDDGFIVGGETVSNDSDVSGNNGFVDYWIIKTDSVGNLDWQKCLGGTLSDRCFSLRQTLDGGYVLTGLTFSNDGDVNGNHGLSDIWVVKLNGGGNIQWQKCLGGTGIEIANCIRQTNDFGFIIAGATQSNDGDVTGFNGGLFDFWIVKIDSSGNLQWQKCLGGTDWESATSIQQTNDGGYIVTGEAVSNNGDVSGNHGGGDYWVVKLDSIGDIQWQKCFGGSLEDHPQIIIQTQNDCYVIAGLAYSNDSDVAGNHGNGDGWITKIDSVGNIKWQKCIGGSNYDVISSVQQTSNSGYIVSGFSKSNDGDVVGNHGLNDAWIIKLAPDTITSITQLPNYQLPISISPNPFQDKLNVTLNTKELSEIIFYDVASRIILQKKFINSVSINTEQLAKGLYLYEVRSKNGLCKKGKVVKD